MTQQGASDSGETTDPLIGQVVNNRYEIVEAIAQGGMGRVYRARQVPLGRTVALKVLQPNYHGNADPGFHKRFFLEAATLARLKCPNTVTVFDYGSEGSVYYIAMEFLEGRTLHRELRRVGHLPLDRVFSITRQICRSLGEAHELGVVHRDLKPANIFLTARDDADDEEGRDLVKVIDFGLVKQVDQTGDALTKSGLFMGSPKYMSPEQIRNHDLDPRADVYSIGVVIYEMLTGRAPFVGKSDIDTLTAHLGQKPPPMASVNPAANVPPEVEAVVNKALAKSPEERHSNVEELYQALKTACAARMSITPTGPWLASMPEVTPSGVQQRAAEDDSPTATRDPTDGGSIQIDIASESPARERRPWLPIALLLLGAAAVGGAFALDDGPEPPARESEEPAPTERPAAAAAEPEEAVAPLPAIEPPPAAPRALVRLSSEPSGAMVIIDRRVYGPTPSEVELVGEEYAVGSSLTAQFQKDGYRDQVLTVTISEESPLEVGAELEPNVRRRWRPRQETTTDQPPPGTTSMWTPI